MSKLQLGKVKNRQVKTRKRAAATGILLIAAAALYAGTPSSSDAGLGTHAEYHVVHGWPVLPEGEVLGEVAGVGVDSHGKVPERHASLA